MRRLATPIALLAVVGSPTAFPAEPLQRLDALTLPQSVDAELGPDDAQLESGEHFDHWFFEGERGEAVTIDLTSEQFDCYLILQRPDGSQTENDDGGEGLNSRISQRLPADGRYALLVTSYGPGETGEYTLALTEGLAPNPEEIAEEAPEIPIALGHRDEAALGAGDTRYHSGRFADLYTFEAEAGRRAVITMDSRVIDCHLTLTLPSGREIINDDVEPGILDSRIELLLPEPGTYRLRASSYATGEVGPYTIAVLDKTRHLPLGVAVRGGFERSVDEVFYVLGELPPRSGDLHVTVEGQDPESDIDLDVLCQLEAGAPWTPVGRSERMGPTESAVIGVVYSPPYLVRLSAPEGREGAFTLHAEPVPIHPFIELGVDLTGVLTPAQSAQAWEFSAPADGYVFVQLESKGGKTALRMGSTAGGRPNGSTAEATLAPIAEGETAWVMVAAVPPEGEPTPDVEFRLQTAFAPAAEELRPGITAEGRIGVEGERTRIHPLLFEEGGAVELRLEAGLPGPSDLALSLLREDTGAVLGRSGGSGNGRVTILASVPPGVQALAVVRGGRDLAVPYRLTAHTERTVIPAELREGTSAWANFTAEGDSTATWRFTPPHAGLFRFTAQLTGWGDDMVGLEVLAPDGAARRAEAPAGQPAAVAVFAEAGEQLWVRASEPTGLAEVTAILNATSATSGALARSDDSSPELWGVFVGIAQYAEGRDLLPHCDDDAESLMDLFVRRGFLRRDHALLLTNEAGTRAAIEEAMRAMAQRVGPEDRFVFFFSGHGGQTGWMEDSAETDHVDEFICPHDTWTPGADILDHELEAMLRTIPAEVAMVFLDSCNAGGFARELSRRPGRIALFASEEDLLSYTYAERKSGGILAHTLLRGFRGEADLNFDGRISAGEISDFVLSEMPQIAISDEDHSDRVAQHPESRRTVPYGTVLFDLAPEG